MRWDRGGNAFLPRKREQRVDDAGWRCFFNGISSLNIFRDRI